MNLAQFWEKVDRTSGCWLWAAGKNNQGYGVCFLDGRRTYVHRLSWELHRGPIPSGLYVCHTCDTPLCLNPDHLFLGTQRDNMADASAKGRTRNQCMGVTHCKHGHEFTPENTGIDLKRNWRFCRICRRVADKRRYYKQKGVAA